MATIDRWFPLGWIGLYLLLPTSGWSTLMLAQWADQVRDLTALKSLLADGHSDYITANAIGPAYIGAAALLNKILGISPEDSLVLLTRASYAASVALALVLVGVFVRRVFGVPPMVSIAAQFSLVAMLFAMGTWFWSDVPWSHFLAMALAVAVYAARLTPMPLRAGNAVLVGLLLSLLYLTRSFEFAAVVLAWVIGAAIVFALRIRPMVRPSIVNVLSGAAAFVVTWVVVNAATGKSGFFLLYGNHLDEQRATANGQDTIVSVAQMPTFSPSFIPTKLVQLFVEPCYYSMCSISDYTGGAKTAGGRFADAEGSELLWRLPLAVQLPSLVLLPACGVVLAAVVVWAARHRRAIEPSATRGLQGLVEMTVAATGLVIGYAASTMIGSSHLRYGLARDFLLPALLTAIVAVTLVTAGLWRLLASRNGRVSPESVLVLLSVAGAVVMVAGAAYARAYGIPRLDGHRLGAVGYTAACEKGVCDVAVDARTTTGDRISIPAASTLTFDCGPGSPDVTVYASSLEGGIRLASCPRPRLAHAWPTVAGLPPGTYELEQAVRVANASPG